MTYNLYIGDACIETGPDEYMKGESRRQPSSSYVIIARTADEAGEKLLAELLEMTGHQWHDPNIKELKEGTELDLDWRVKVLGEVLDVIR